MRRRSTDMTATCAEMSSERSASTPAKQTHQTHMLAQATPVLPVHTTGNCKHKTKSRQHRLLISYADFRAVAERLRS